MRFCNFRVLLLSNDGVSWLRFATFVSLFDRINSIRFVFHSISLRFVFLSSAVLCCYWLFHLYISLIFCWIGYFCLVCVCECTNNNNCDYYLLCNCDRIEYSCSFNKFLLLWFWLCLRLMLMNLQLWLLCGMCLRIQFVIARLMMMLLLAVAVVSGAGGDDVRDDSYCCRCKKENDSIFELISHCTIER